MNDDIVDQLLADGVRQSEREARIVMSRLLKSAADEIKRLRAEAADGRAKATEKKLAECERERDEARTLTARLRQEAEMWAGEARCHKSTVHECYQAVTGAKGEPGNWNGAKPVVDELARLRTRTEALEKAAIALIDFHNGPVMEKRPDIHQRLLQRLENAISTKGGE